MFSAAFHRVTPSETNKFPIDNQRLNGNCLRILLTYTLLWKTSESKDKEGRRKHTKRPTLCVTKTSANCLFNSNTNKVPLTHSGRNPKKERYR